MTSRTLDVDPKSGWANESPRRAVIPENPNRLRSDLLSTRFRICLAQVIVNRDVGQVLDLAAGPRAEVGLFDSETV